MNFPPSNLQLLAPHEFLKMQSHSSKNSQISAKRQPIESPQASPARSRTCLYESQTFFYNKQRPLTAVQNRNPQASQTARMSTNRISKTLLHLLTANSPQIKTTYSRRSTNPPAIDNHTQIWNPVQPDTQFHTSFLSNRFRSCQTVDLPRCLNSFKFPHLQKGTVFRALKPSASPAFADFVTCASSTVHRQSREPIQPVVFIRIKSCHQGHPLSNNKIRPLSLRKSSHGKNRPNSTLQPVQLGKSWRIHSTSHLKTAIEHM